MYNFDELHDRKNSQSIKWGMLEEKFGSHDVLPMWVADMDFKTAQAIIDAIKNRAEEGIYGYTLPVDSYYQSFVDWCEKRHQWSIKKEELIFSPGVVPALIYSIKCLTQLNDQIVIQSPVYGPFARSIEQHGRQVVNNPLIEDQGYYTMDFENLEMHFKAGVKFMILCNPHNPVGRVWANDELKQLSKLIEQYNVTVISDEIHSDLIFKGFKHKPLASYKNIQEQVITCMAPSKTFNLAGLQSSIIHTYNHKFHETLSEMYEKMDMKINNCFGQVAFEAAYNEGLPWLEAVLAYIEENMDYALSEVEHIEGIKARKPQGTYLLWLDCRELGLSHEDLKLFMQEKAKVGLTDGAFFGEAGQGFMRLNLATPRKNVEEGLARISKAVKELK